MAYVHEVLAEELALPLYLSMTDAEALIELEVVDKVQNKKTMKRTSIMTQQDDPDYLALTDTKKDRWLFFLSMIPEGGVDPFDHAMVQIVKEIWGDASQTVSNLAANRTETVSRLKQLGVSNITEADITLARTLIP